MTNKQYFKHPEHKEFVKILENIDHAKQIWEVFYDFCELSARTFALPFYQSEMTEPLKVLYGKYTRQQLEQFDKAFELIVSSLDESYHDFLGDVFSAMELSNKWKGQFFTPFHVCELMAKMQLGNMDEKLKEKPYITISDPACGAGALLIACAKVFREEKKNHSLDAYFVAQDIDRLAFFMCYIQLSLCGVAGEVIWGDTLALEVKESWCTPVVFINEVWQYRLMMRKFETMMKPDKEAVPTVQTKSKPIMKEGQTQLTLF